MGERRSASSCSTADTSCWPRFTPVSSCAASATHVCAVKPSIRRMKKAARQSLTRRRWVSEFLQHEPVDPYRREEPPPLLVVISGPSGVGKDATIKRMKEMGYPFHFVVTATTRPRREGEIDGVDYFFASMGDFAQMIEAGELLEYAVVYGQYKGIPKQQVREAFASGKDVVLRIDVQDAG